MKVGGTNTPVAEMQLMTVIILLFSALVSTPTVLFSFFAVILQGAWHIVNPLSSTLYRLLGGILRDPSALNQGWHDIYHANPTVSS